ncbi:MAG: EutN/CcmL family microcompartment protein [Bryobacterales bacterium]|nr:EutN/CcmL family microcompartment protein [Bryobacterales bacterium]
MILARVVGNVVATRKDARLEGKKLLVLQHLTPAGAARDQYVVALDTVGAGDGERVLCVAGSSARMASGMKDTPVDTAIVGIVDEISMLPGEG